MQPINLNEYEVLARARINKFEWDYIEGGADDENTIRENRAAFQRIRLRPRMLVNVRNIDLHTTVLGTPVTMPILLAPSSSHCMVHPEGEVATARGAGAVGTLMALSTVSTRSLEDVAKAAPGPLWFQLYTYKGPRISESLVRRAEAAGYRAIILTVDLPNVGKRERELRNNFVLPPPPLREANFDIEDQTGIKATEQMGIDTWDSIGWLRSITSLPLLIKGILTAEDAELAVQHGIDGIIVSNHGGRQLDGAIASIEALPEIVDAVAGHCEVYLDSGVRRGTDVLKALALGARAVFIGRPIYWGLAVNGHEGVRHVLGILHDELELAMALSGKTTLASIDRSLVKI